MEQQIPWLNRSSFENRLTLPTNFNLSVFTPYLTDIYETVLPALLGQPKLAELIDWLRLNPYGVITPVAVTEEEIDSLVDSPDLTVAPLPPLAQLFKLVQAYLVYAVYAEFVMKGDVQNTDVGIVRKELESAEALTDVQRTQLYRNYRDLADSRARLIAEFIQTERNSCTALLASSGLRISSSRGRTKSVFD